MPHNHPPRVVSLLTCPKIQVIFAVISLGVIIVFNSSIFYLLPYDGALISSGSNAIIQLDNGGPAEKAGARFGDQIVRIDGNPVDLWGRYPSYPPGVQKGESLIYEIQRGDQTLYLSVVVDSLWQHQGLLFVLIGLIFLSIVFWILGILICVYVPAEDYRARMIGLLLLTVGLIVSAGGPGSATSFWGARTVFNITLCLLSFAGITAHLYFPASAFSPGQSKHIVNILATISLLFAFTAALNDLVIGAALTPLGLYKIYDIYMLVSMGAIVGLLFRSRFLIKEPDIRRQTNIVLWGTILGFAPFFIFTLLPIIIFGPGHEYLDGNYSVLFLIFIPVSYAYTIFQRKILKIDFIVNRLVVFFSLAMFVLLVSFVTLGFFAIIFKLPTQTPLYGGLMATLMVLPAVYFQTRIQAMVNQVLYGSHYDHISILSNLSNRLAQTINRTHLTTLLTQDLSRQMGIRHAAFFLVEGNHLVQQDAAEPFIVSLNDELCTFLLDRQMPVRAQYMWELITHQTQSRWQRFQWGQVIAPIILEKQLRGVLVLGDRVAGEIFSDLDVKIISSVAQQAALAAANVQLVETLRGMIQQKVRSEEAQRKQVASELHDGVLQVLFFFKQKLDPDDVELTNHLDKIIELIRHTIKAQRPSLLDRGLPLALQDLVDDMVGLAGEDGPSISWQHDVENLHITDEKATSIYRIANEAIINALKHANAKHIRVMLSQRDDVLVLHVQDDGSGMADVQTVPEHYGLAWMDERAMMIGARLRIDANPGEGTRVILEVKL